MNKMCSSKFSVRVSQDHMQALIKIYVAIVVTNKLTFDNILIHDTWQVGNTKLNLTAPRN